MKLMIIAAMVATATAATCGGTDPGDPGTETPTPGGDYGDDLVLYECTVGVDEIGLTNQVTISESGGYRHFESNGVPDHPVAPFPNSGNPNSIQAQSYDYQAPINPSGDGAQLEMYPEGIAINGVVFDPGAAEYYQNDPNSGWQYEALSGAINLGLDCNKGHVQPSGAYHYHGMPEGILDNLGGGVAVFHVGFAADGYPVYARYGYGDADDPTSEIRALYSSWVLKEGTRPSGPGGTYDGSFVQDYEYVAGAGDLDECNGRTGFTEEFGTTYYYVLTDTFPFIPRCFIATPDPSFTTRGGPPGGGPPPGRAAASGPMRSDRLNGGF